MPTLVIEPVSLDFLTSPGHHTATFRLSDGEKVLFTIPVVVRQVPGGVAAIYERAHENLVTLLELATTAGREAAERARRPAG